MKKSRIKLFAKILLTIVALIFVFHKIDADTVLQQIKEAKTLYIIPSIVFFVLSKMISAFRLNHIFKSFAICLSDKINLMLYWRGMFYNIFLPGSISGDLYKAYYLKRNYKIRVKEGLSAIVIDRVNGVLVLLFLLAIPFVFVCNGINKFVIPFGIILTFGGFIYTIRNYFHPVSNKVLRISIYSVFVQLAQLISAGFLLYALNTEALGTILIYLFVFLISSVAAALPITIGGMGTRELTFAYLSSFFDYDASIAVSLSLLFQLITLIVSLTGGMVTLKEDKLTSPVL